MPLQHHACPSKITHAPPTSHMPQQDHRDLKGRRQLHSGVQERCAQMTSKHAHQAPLQFVHTSLQNTLCMESILDNPRLPITHAIVSQATAASQPMLRCMRNCMAITSHGITLNRKCPISLPPPSSLLNPHEHGGGLTSISRAASPACTMPGRRNYQARAQRSCRQPQRHLGGTRCCSPPPSRVPYTCGQGDEATELGTPGSQSVTPLADM
jgi:hypothetical protein